MMTSDREPQYLGTHRGISRIQLGWTTLYFHGDAYTHAIGNLYGTHEQPAREDIAAARKAIPVKPRPPVMAHAPGRDHKERRQEHKAPTPTKKPPPSAAPHPTAKKSSIPLGTKPAQASAKPGPERTPKEKKPASSHTSTAAKRAKKGAKAPIATMADLRASVAGAAPATKAKPISSMGELTAQLGS